jgi:hypothetical protein
MNRKGELPRELLVGLAVTVVGGLILSAISQAPSLQVAGTPVVGATQTKIPLRTKSDLPVIVHGSAGMRKKLER